MSPLDRQKAIGSVGIAVVAAHAAYRQVGRTWGASYQEAREQLPGDELVPHADSQTTMGIDIEVPPAEVWPWIIQMGVDRAGLYTHNWVENGLLRLKVRNADQIVPKWQDLKVGDHIWFIPEEYPAPRYGPRVAMIERNQVLICTFGENHHKYLGTWQFILRPLGPTTTRLIFRSRASNTRPVGTRLFDLVAEPGYLYMDIGMLHGIKTRAEQASISQIPGLHHSDHPAKTALIAVASQQGSTRQIAMAMAMELAKLNIATDVRVVDEVEDIVGYDAVIIGSAIHTHHWLKEAVHFIDRHQMDLRTRPVWLFSTGMLTVDTGAPWPNEYPREIGQLMTASGAREHQRFAGRRQITEPKFLWSFVVRLIALTSHFHLTLGDFRDWNAIGEWSDQIGETIQSHALTAASG